MRRRAGQHPVDIGDIVAIGWAPEKARFFPQWPKPVSKGAERHDRRQSTFRRRFLRSTGLAATVGLGDADGVDRKRAFGADTDHGRRRRWRARRAAIRKAFYDPFEKETGIKVVGVVHEADPTVQFKLLVETKSYIWDLCMVTPAHVGLLKKGKNYIEPLNITEEEGKDLLPGMLTPDWLAFSVYSVIRAYRTDKFGSNVPETWADFWNVEKFPGRRGLYRGLGGMIEGALMADGVPQKDLYPLDVDRALKSLTKIKKSINVWWTSGAQNTQLLQNGEIDLIDTGARVPMRRSTAARR